MKKRIHANKHKIRSNGKTGAREPVLTVKTYKSNDYCHEVPAVYYKIVEIHKGAVKTLFHGLNGSRTIPVGEWLAADKKLVRDGTSKTQYLSGWHVLPTLKECEEYLEIFTRRLDLLCIVPCEVRGEIRPKVHSRSNVFLADQIKILPGALGSG